MWSLTVCNMLEIESTLEWSRVFSQWTHVCGETDLGALGGCCVDMSPQDQQVNRDLLPNFHEGKQTLF